jgi:hypothetical protein
MNRAALLKKSDAMRFAEWAKQAGIPIEVEVRGVKIVFRPEGEKVDANREIVL